MFVGATRPGLALVLGLGLGAFSGTGAGGNTPATSVADDSTDSDYPDATTYAGPDAFDTTDSEPWPTTTTTDSSTTDDYPDASTYAGPDESTTTDGPGGSSTTDASGTTETDTDTGEKCVPITEDPSGVGIQCESDMDCLPGYSCQPFQGIVLQTSCQVLCEQTCECPAGLACLDVADKSGMAWHQCG